MRTTEDRNRESWLQSSADETNGDDEKERRSDSVDGQCAGDEVGTKTAKMARKDATCPGMMLSSLETIMEEL